MLFRLLVTSTKPGIWRNFLGQCRGPLVQLVKIGVLQGVLVLRRRNLPANADHRRILHIHLDARHGGQFGAQALDDLVRRRVPFMARLENHEHSAGVGGRADAARPDSRHEGSDVRLLGDDLGHRTLMLDHRLERGVLCAFGESDDLAGVAARQEILGNQREQVGGQRQCGKKAGQNGAWMAHRQAANVFS